MFIAHLQFGGDPTRRAKRAAQTDSAGWYLAMLLKNGQICGDYIVGWTRRGLEAWAEIPAADALLDKFHSGYGTDQLAGLRDKFGKAPTWRIIGGEGPRRSRHWRTASSLYLYTSAVEPNGCVGHGDASYIIPTYQIPVSDDTREKIYFWAAQYRRIDKVWMASGALETATYKQMAEPQSMLTEQGLELCGEVEKATGKPTYYFLYRYHARAAGEDARRCPRCGGKWRVPRIAGRKHKFHEFEFRCEPCRLVSHAGVTCDGERLARIGEYRAGRRHR